MRTWGEIGPARGAAANAHAEGLWLKPAAAIVLLVWVAAAVAAERNGISALPLAGRYMADALRAVAMLIALLLVYHCVRAVLPRDSAVAIGSARALRDRLSGPWLVLGTFGPLILLSVLLGAFGTLKVLLPHYAPFAYDGQFAALDRTIFLGVDPWRITHALFGGTTATLVIDRIYSAWIALLPFSICGFALLAPRIERARFMLAMVLIWPVLGIAGAYAGSSVGPIFLDLLGHPEAARFEGMMRNLAAAHAQALPRGLDALHWREVLWNAYVERDLSFGMGISAMPSLHNGVAVLYAFAAFRFGRGPGLAASLFAAVIFVGSVHLAWHYAVDGIAAAAAVALIWIGVDRYLHICGYDRLVTAEPGLNDPAVPASAAAAR